MTDRKPDFYVVKREGLDGAPEWFTFDADGHVWDYQLTLFYTARTKRAVNSLTVERGPKGGAA